jgi:uncharacterized membrane protein YjjP (DUF1212 family)
MTNPTLESNSAATELETRSKLKIESILDAAVTVVENGGSTAMADRLFNNFARGFQLETISAIWRLDCLFVTCREDGRLVTLMRTIGPVGLNLLRVSEAATLSERAATGQVDAATFASEIDRIRELPFPYSRWAMAFAAACAGATFSQTMAGDVGALALCAVAAGIGQLARSQLQGRKFTRMSVTFICALLSGLIATAGLRLGISQSVPATLIGSMIYTVPGLLLINGFLDLTSEQFLFSGVQRLVHVAFLFMILCIAVGVADALL